MITNRDLEVDPLFRSARIGTLRREATLTGQLFAVSTEPVRSIPLSVDADGSLPTWLDPSLRKLEQITRLGPNWDSYGARPVSSESLERALEFMNEFMIDFGSLTPDIAPTVRGGVQFGFRRGDETLEVTLLADLGTVYYDDGHGVSWEGGVERERGRLRNILRRMST